MNTQVQTLNSDELRQNEQDLAKYRFEQNVPQAGLDLLFVEFSEMLEAKSNDTYSLKDLRDIREKLLFPLQW